jgi:hypothetical protein
VSFDQSLNLQTRIDWYSTPWLSYLEMNWNPSFFVHPRVARGTKTFFQDVMMSWPPMDYLIQCDVVKCFDCIRHDLLLPLLGECFGPENEDFVKLIQAFLTTEIFDKNGRNYACREVGIPQGSPISPVLMNVFLHQLDKQLFESFLGVPGPEGVDEWQVKIFYARYADDILFGIPRVTEAPDMLKLKENLRTVKGVPMFRIGVGWGSARSKSTTLTRMKTFPLFDRLSEGKIRLTTFKPCHFLCRMLCSTPKPTPGTFLCTSPSPPLY